MQTVQLIYLRALLQSAMVGRMGTSFQDFFVSVAKAVWGAQFQTIRPYGKLGDLKCDGRIATEGRFFQCYAPYAVSSAKVHTKVRADFEGAKQEFGSQLTRWTFVINDREGLDAASDRELSTLRMEYPGIEFDVLGPHELEALILKLPEPDIAALFDVSVEDLATASPFLLRRPRLGAADEADRFSFMRDDLQFRGRNDELVALKEFLDADQRFRWCLMTGGAGAGKSRLALELVDRSVEANWIAGFVWQGEAIGGDVAKWRPPADHLLVVDYVLSNAALIRTMLLAFASNASRYKRKVRLLLIERAEDAYLDATIWRTPNEQRELDAYRYKNRALVLKAQNKDDRWAVAQALLGEARIDRDQFLDQHRQLDKEERTLTAMILADALSRNERGFSSLSEVLDDLIEHERALWGDQGIRRTAEEPLLALASMIDGFIPERDGQRLPDAIRDQLSNDGERGLRALGHYSADGRRLADATVGRLLPDLVGEYFSLSSLGEKSSVTGKFPNQWLSSVAWATGDGSLMGDFVQRALRDFKGHPGLTAVATPIEGVMLSYLWSAYVGMETRVDVTKKDIERQRNVQAELEIDTLLRSPDRQSAVAAAHFFFWATTGDVIGVRTLESIQAKLAARIRDQPDRQMQEPLLKGSANLARRASRPIRRRRIRTDGQPDSGRWFEIPGAPYFGFRVAAGANERVTAVVQKLGTRVDVRTYALPGEILVAEVDAGKTVTVYALNSDEVRNVVRRRNVVWLDAHWTRRAYNVHHPAAVTVEGAVDGVWMAKRIGRLDVDLRAVHEVDGQDRRILILGVYDIGHLSATMNAIAEVKGVSAVSRTKPSMLRTLEIPLIMGPTRAGLDVLSAT